MADGLWQVGLWQACERWPGAPITLRQGARVIEDSRRTALGLG